MYQDNAKSWCITFLSGKSAGKSGKTICAINPEHIPGADMSFPVIIMQKIRAKGGIIRTFSYFWMFFRFKSKFNLLLFLCTLPLVK